MSYLTLMCWSLFGELDLPTQRCGLGGSLGDWIGDIHPPADLASSAKLLTLANSLKELFEDINS